MIPGAKCCTWRKKCSTWCRYRSWYKVLPPQSWSSFPPNHTMVVVQSPFLQNCFKRIHDKPKSERYFILQNKLHMMRLRLWELHGMKLVLFKIGFGLATHKLSSTGEKTISSLLAETMSQQHYDVFHTATIGLPALSHSRAHSLGLPADPILLLNLPDSSAALHPQGKSQQTSCSQ